MKQVPVFADLAKSKARNGLFYRVKALAEEVTNKLNLNLSANAISKQAKSRRRGRVYIVGAGPGEPDLLTVKALKLIQQCDVLVYDRLVSEQILALVPKSTKRISVGKKAGYHSVPQPQINRLLVELASRGKQVCRLKGGDPFVFGRGGEEIEQLVADGIEFQVVPGITAAAGCAAYAGIPLTHRDYAQSVQFVTGHLKASGEQIDWQKKAEPNQTLVIYMGVMNCEDIATQLMIHGRASTTPVAVIEKGSTAQQRVITGQLSHLSQLVEQQAITTPALLIIGEVVNLRQVCNWFEPGAIAEQADQAFLANLA